jgi:hypothetical protein
MPGRTHLAAPGEPACPEPGCGRPAGFATDHEGTGRCRRHEPHGSRHASHVEACRAVPLPRVAPENVREASPLDRRLRGPTNPSPDPLGVVRTILLAARRAGFTFETAWTLAAEAALSYLTERQAREWWDVLSATEDGWRSAWVQETSPLGELDAPAR